MRRVGKDDLMTINHDAQDDDDDVVNTENKKRAGEVLDYKSDHLPELP